MAKATLIVFFLDVKIEGFYGVTRGMNRGDIMDVK